MEITEAQVEKGNLERAIALLIMKFEKETGLKVSKIYYDNIVSEAHGNDFEVSVTIEL
jgi:hypothetical protein